jgi:hypothetical protein
MPGRCGRPAAQHGFVIGGPFGAGRPVVRLGRRPRARLRPRVQHRLVAVGDFEAGRLPRTRRGPGPVRPPRIRRSTRTWPRARVWRPGPGQPPNLRRQARIRRRTWARRGARVWRWPGPGQPPGLRRQARIRRRTWARRRARVWRRPGRRTRARGARAGRMALRQTRARAGRARHLGARRHRAWRERPTQARVRPGRLAGAGGPPARAEQYHDHQDAAADTRRDQGYRGQPGRRVRGVRDRVAQRADRPDAEPGRQH